MKISAYKVATFVLIGTIGLAGCSSLKPHHATNKNHYDPHKINSNDNYHSKHPNKPSSENISLDSYVTRLSEKNTHLAKKATIMDDNTVMTIVINKNGEKQIFISQDIDYKPGARHTASEILSVSNSSTVFFKGSHCLLWSDGSSGTSGGSAHSGAFCVIRGSH